MSKILIFAILSVFTLFGCVDALELEPENSLTFGFGFNGKGIGIVYSGSPTAHSFGDDDVL